MLPLLVCRVTGCRGDSCGSSLTAAGAPSPLTQVGVQSMGDGAGGVA